MSGTPGICSLFGPILNLRFSQLDISFAVEDFHSNWSIDHASFRTKGTGIIFGLFGLTIL
jgi:hypothetical protein